MRTGRDHGEDAAKTESAGIRVESFTRRKATRGTSPVRRPPRGGVAFAAVALAPDGADRSGDRELILSVRSR